MSWLLFLDESGHDHCKMPYEVRGGVALAVGKLWPFIRAVQDLELRAFGVPLSLYKHEIKGSTLLDKKRFRFASQGDRMADEERRKHCRAFLTKGLEKKQPCRSEFTAYGQACLEMADGLFELLQANGARVFASAIPRGARAHGGEPFEEYLRKDQVFLLERFFYHLESQQKHGILVMDAVEKAEDSRFVRRLQNYFMKTAAGRERATWVVPAPFFVSSDMVYAVQAADVCIYCLNWGFRLPRLGMDEPVRPEIAERYASRLGRMQFRGDGYNRRYDRSFKCSGIVYVSDPYEPRT